ncbi:MAG TPA: hypothetical protein VGY76_09335 [Solirubrobacteraceae bacterium]|jgi:hypothetical protein|nr:hypothetical protein [Solirubrobacteraceae bacterium]
MLAKARAKTRRGKQALTPSAPTPSAPAYEGILQGVGNGVALGWAANRAEPEARVQVALVVDGEIVAEGSADVPRPDLADMALGDGAHGFLIALPEHLQTPARRRIVALAGPERTPLEPAPSFWHKPTAEGAWSDVVFEPGGALSAKVPDPPPPAQSRRAVWDEGWLFLEGEGRGLGNEAQCAQAVATLVHNAQECEALGIAYIPALIPSKREVISEPGTRAGSGLANLRAQLREVDEVELLDLLAVLHDCKRGGSPYHRTDADWNDRGAFFVARALLKEAHKRAPALRPPPVSELHVRPVPGYRGTLADAPKLRQEGEELIECDLEVPSEPGIALDPSRLRSLRMPVEAHLAQAGETHLRVYATPEQDEEARVAVVGDDAALSLIPWLAERTSRTTFFFTRALPLAQLELELPRVVLHLLREADLAQLTPPGVPE